jgi:hypothetical protein
MDDMAKKNAYATLNLKSGASEKEVTIAYRKLAMRYHPDRNPNDKEAADKFMEVTRAYEYITKGANSDEFTGSNSIFEFIKREEKRRAAADDKKPEVKKAKDEFAEPFSKSKEVAPTKSYRERLEDSLATFRRVVGDIKPHIDAAKTQGVVIVTEAAKKVGTADDWRKRAGAASDYLGSGDIERKANTAMDAIDDTLAGLGIPKGLKESGVRGMLSSALSDAVNGASTILGDLSRTTPPAKPPAADIPAAEETPAAPAAEESAPAAPQKPRRKKPGKGPQP